METGTRLPPNTKLRATHAGTSAHACTHTETHARADTGMTELMCLRKGFLQIPKLISRLEDANDWPTWNQQHEARTHTAPWTDGLQDHTSTRIPLSHSTSLLLYLCHPSHHRLILSQSLCLSFPLTHSPTLSAAVVHILSLSSALSICFFFCPSFLTLPLTKSLHVHNFQVPVVHLSSIRTNTATAPKLHQLKSAAIARLLVQTRQCKVK